MTNLIPLSAQRKVKREYWLRVLSTWAISASFGFIILSILTLPIYVLVTLQLKNHSDTITIISAEKEELGILESVLSEANQYARLVTSQKPSLSLTDHAQMINNIAGTGIKITSLQLSVSDAEKKIVVSGLAESRLLLANFRDTVESNDNYDQVILPLTSLIRDRDIEFSMTLLVIDTNTI